MHEKSEFVHIIAVFLLDSEFCAANAISQHSTCNNSLDFTAGHTQVIFTPVMQFPGLFHSSTISSNQPPAPGRE